jgi:hypothetical protein
LLSPTTNENAAKDYGTESNGVNSTKKGDEEQDAMTRRLSEMTEQTLEEGGRAGVKAFKEAGFSEELKQRLAKRIEEGKFKSSNASAFAQTEMPVRIDLIF